MEFIMPLLLGIGLITALALLLLGLVSSSWQVLLAIMEFIVPLLLGIGLITTIGLLLLGLVSASWQVLLVILIVGLVLTRKLIQQASSPEQIQQASSPESAVSIQSSVAEVKDQGFIYRGVCYEKDGCLNTDEGQRKEEFAGKYRGVNCTYIKQEKQIPSPNNTKIKYRGASLT